jgi:hypothetical protein
MAPSVTAVFLQRRNKPIELQVVKAPVIAPQSDV